MATAPGGEAAVVARMGLIKDRLGVRAPSAAVVAALMVATIALSVLLSALVIDADPPPSELPQGVEVVYRSFVVPAHGLARGDASCPAGKVVTGGGTYSNAVNSALLVLDSFPVRTGGSYMWRARFSNKSATEITVGTVAVCAAVASTSATTGRITTTPRTSTATTTTRRRPQSQQGTATTRTRPQTPPATATTTTADGR